MKNASSEKKIAAINVATSDHKKRETMSIKTILAVALLSIAAFSAQAVTPVAAPTSAASATYVANTKVLRKQSTKVAFVKANACPATGKNVLPCKGYIIDHKVPLCAGGKDEVANMQWQTVAESQKKDVLERKQCAALKKVAKPASAVK